MLLIKKEYDGEYLKVPSKSILLVEIYIQVIHDFLIFLG